MKNIKNLLIAGALALAGVAFSVVPASAGPMEDAVVRELSGPEYWKSVQSSSSPLVLLYYVGTATEAVVDIDGDSIEAEAPDGTDDTSFGTSGAYDLSNAAYNTMGEICDAIDALSSYGCRLLGAKRDDSSLLLRNQTSTTGTNDLKAAGGFEVLMDTGATTAAPNNAYDLRLGFTPQPGKRIVLKKCTVNANGATDWRVYGKTVDRAVEHALNDRYFKRGTFNDTTLVFKEVIADDTEESQDFTVSQAGRGWEFGVDEHVVVSAGNSTNLQFAETSILRCLVQER